MATRAESKRKAIRGSYGHNVRSKILRSAVIDSELHGRLLNWGRYLRSDNTYYKLDYPHRCPFTVEATHGETIFELDADHIESIVSAFATCEFPVSNQYAFVLKVEYAERSDSFLAPVAIRARDVSRRYGIKCSERGYYSMLYMARKAVQAFVEPL